MNPDLLQRAQAILAEVHAQGEPLRLDIDLRGVRATLTVQPLYSSVTALEGGAVQVVTSTKRPAREGAGDGPAKPHDSLDVPIKPGNKKWFSPTEEKIMEVMTDDWQTKAVLADKCSITASSQFNVILTNLVDRECIESGHRGYRFRQPAGTPRNKPTRATPPRQPDPAAEDTAMKGKILDLVSKRQRVSVGEILSHFPVKKAPAVKDAVKEMYMDARLDKDTEGYYSLPVSEGQP